MGEMTEEQIEENDKRVLFYRKHPFLRRAHLLYVIPLCVATGVVVVMPMKGVLGLMEYTSDMRQLFKGFWNNNEKTIAEQIQRNRSRRLGGSFNE